jgi:Tfp pilus assembly PilM family ATPase
MLEERFGTTVEAFDPFRAVAWDDRLGAAEDAAPSAAVAVGLALRKAADR